MYGAGDYVKLFDARLPYLSAVLICYPTPNGRPSLSLSLEVGALVYARFMWNRREQLGLSKGLSIPGWSEVQQFLGSGGAMVFRQVLLFCFAL